LTDYEQINNYLEGKLQGEELKAFEHRIQTDPSFAETVQLYSNINKELDQGTEDLPLKQNLAALNEKYFGKPAGAKVTSIRRTRLRIFIQVAAAAAVAAFVIVLLVTNRQSDISTQFASLTKRDSLPTALRGQGEDSLKQAIAQTYNNKQYAVALPLLERYTAIHPGEAIYSFAKGVCYAETNNYAAAIDVFDPLISGSSVVKYKAIAMKAQILYKQKKRKDAAEVLKLIPPGTEEYNSARQLIEVLQ
jgi:tetratricopeptide (TPR) repeat protein